MSGEMHLHITPYFAKKANLESIVDDNPAKNTLNPVINIEREAFEFPENFSFSDDEFRMKVTNLFSLHSSEEGSSKKEKKQNKKDLRHIYQEKVEDYLVKYKDWHPSTTNKIVKIIGLPHYQQKTLNYYIKNKELPSAKAVIRGASQLAQIGLASVTVANFEENIADAFAQFMNVDRKMLTRMNIGYDTAVLYGELFAAHNLILNDLQSPDFLDAPLIAMIGKGIFYTVQLVHTAFRAGQIIYRPYQNEFKGKHTPSYALAVSWYLWESVPLLMSMNYNRKVRARKRLEMKNHLTVQSKNYPFHAENGGTKSSYLQNSHLDDGEFKQLEKEVKIATITSEHTTYSSKSTPY